MTLYKAATGYLFINTNHGRVAQRKSNRRQRGRSLVKVQSRPTISSRNVGLEAAIIQGVAITTKVIKLAGDNSDCL